MPPYYGEKSKAFTRLQLEIIESSDDESISAWESNANAVGVMLSISPKALTKARRIVNRRLRPQERIIYPITNEGLQFGSARDVFDRSTADHVGYRDLVLELSCFNGSRKALTALEFNAGQLWEDCALTVELKRLGPI